MILSAISAAEISDFAPLGQISHTLLDKSHIKKSRLFTALSMSYCYTITVSFDQSKHVRN